MKLRIISDDFTSATDGLSGFAEQGWATAVAFSSDQFQSTSIVSTDTDSRTLPAQAAAHAAATWAAAWQGADILVKQFDSTLRGPVAQEVQAAWAASGKPKLLVIPAFPAAGRITVNANVLVNGIPVAQTAFAQDPLNPVEESNILKLFAQAGIALSHAKNANEAIWALESSQAVAMDASSEEDLQSIVQMAWARTDIFWAGSTGLLRAFSQALPSLSKPAHTYSRAFKPAQHAAIVVGSHNPQSRIQLQHAQSVLSNVQIFSTPAEICEPGLATAQLVERVVQAIQCGACDGLVVTGGETAKHIARALQASGIQVLREVQPGIPLCVLQTPFGNFPLITKAGGFGDANIFVECVSTLCGDVASVFSTDCKR